MPMKRISFGAGAGAWLILVAGCVDSFDGSAPSSSLESGTYVGTLDCETSDSASPDGIVRSTVEVSIVINDRGVPVVGEQELAAGRRVALHGQSVAFLHIEAVENGMMWWFEPTSDSFFHKQNVQSQSQISPDAHTSGSSQLIQVEAGELRYDIIQILRHEAGGLKVEQCNGLLGK